MQRYWVVTVGAVLLIGSYLWAEDRAVSMLSTFTRPAHFSEQDQFYRDYITTNDNQIMREYQNRWQYHEIKSPYGGAVTRYDFLSIGTLDYFGRAPYEGQVREAFAQQAFRMRMDGTMRSYFANPERARSVRKAHRVIQQVQDVRVVFSDNHDTPKLHVGYDVFLDKGKLAIVWPKVMDFHIYHAHLTGALIEKRYSISGITLQMAFSVGMDSSTRINYEAEAQAFAMSYSQAFGTGWNGEISFSQSTKSPNDRGSFARLIYSF